MHLGTVFSPAHVMRLLAVAVAFGVSVLVVATPDLYSAVVRGGEPMVPLSRDRFQFLRLALACLGAAALCFCLLHRHAQDWGPFQHLMAAVPFAAIIVVALYKLGFGSTDRYYLRFIREDGPVEYATAATFLVGSAVAARACALARDLQARAFLALFALGMLFIALSEVSFGQRVLGLETPDALVAINRQKEMSVHNIYGIEFVVYQIMPQVIFAYALFSPVLSRYLAASRIGPHLSRDLLAVAPIPWYAVGYFLPMVIYSMKSHFVEDAVWQDQEPSELFMAIGFLMVSVQAWILLVAATPRPAVSEMTGRRGRVRPP